MTKPLFAGDTRKPVRWLHYKGELSDIPMEMGPDTVGPGFPWGFGQLLYPVTAEWDPKTDVTTVGLSYIVPSPEVIVSE